MLLQGLRASHAKTGEALEARLLDPLRLSGGAIIPAGTLLTGSVTAAKPPRRVFRPASLRVGFQNPRLSDGRILPIATVQRGNDVHLPQYTELELTFARPVTLR